MDAGLAIIIDDEPDVATYLAIVLRDNGWEALTANSAGEGLRLAEERTPDVVFLDIMMPERGGMSTLVALRKHPVLSRVPVIFVTGIQSHLTEDFEAYLDRFKHYHADAFLEKPVKPELVLETLEKVCLTPVS
jgi:two-component system alkaline phosphatase synthesis response regulator PhoP